jgi:hypothetical protein
MNELVLLLAGFALAHAAWSMSDLAQGELLTPLIIVSVEERRTLTRFEAPTQAEAIAQGREAVARETQSRHAWAFAHDATLSLSSGAVDMLVVEFWEPGMPTPVHIVQRYEPYALRQQFHVIGMMELNVGDVVLAEKSATVARAIIMEGVESHPRAGQLWKGWQISAP